MKTQRRSCGLVVQVQTGVRPDWAPTPALPLTGCLALGKFRSPSGLFSPVQWGYLP